MNILADIKTALASLDLPCAVSIYEGTADAYIVVTPLTERSDDISDNTELTETHDVDVNLYIKGNYQSTKNTAISLLKSAGFFIADRRYIAYETETGHHHYVITVEKKEVL